MINYKNIKLKGEITINKLRDKIKDKELWKSKYEYRLNYYKNIMNIEKIFFRNS